jgi:predicted Fe-Mo cluster-binding NifX family protein
MKVAVTAPAPSLDATVDPRFGRCAYFVVVDPETMQFEGLENANAGSSQGAGIATAQMIAGEGVEAVLTGNCGPNAYQALEAAGVKVVTGVTGTIREAVEGYRSGRYQPTSQPNVASHHGMGMGGGMGRGMGGGMGRMAAPRPAPSGAPESGLMEVLKELKGQLDDLRQQVGDINERIEKLHKDD